MFNPSSIDPEDTKRIVIAAICSLVGCLIGSFLFPGIGTMIGEMCVAE